MRIIVQNGAWREKRACLRLHCTNSYQMCHTSARATHLCKNMGAFRKFNLTGSRHVVESKPEPAYQSIEYKCHTLAKGTCQVCSRCTKIETPLSKNICLLTKQNLRATMRVKIVNISSHQASLHTFHVLRITSGLRTQIF